MTWDNNTTAASLISRTEAITKIKQLAATQGYTAGVKVFYDGLEMETAASLPAEVDMQKVRVANKLNNA